MQIVNTIQDLVASKMAVDSTHVWVGIWQALTSVSDARQCCVPGFGFQHSDFPDQSEGETDYFLCYPDALKELVYILNTKVSSIGFRGCRVRIIYSNE
jgi:hypothetical protein